MGSSHSGGGWDKLIATGVFLTLTALSIFGSEERRKKLKTLLKGGGTGRQIQMVFIFLASGAAFVLGRDSTDPTVKRLRDATLAGFMAFIIALFAHLDLIIAPFWLVWTLSFFYGKTDF